MKERRQFKRWEVSIPCTLEWGGSSTKGQIANLSFSGALIKRVNAVPSKDTPVILGFQVKKEQVEVECKLSARIVHRSRQLQESGDIIWLGVQFEESIEEVRAKLNPVFHAFASNQQGN